MDTNDTNDKNIEIEKWDELEIKSDLLRGIYAYGFESPSNIQKKAIIPIIQGKDVIAQAQSGSGKTGTFSIGALQCINVEEKVPQVLILSPTHELVKQTANVILGIGSFIEGLQVKTLIGGTSIRDDASFLKDTGAHVIVGSVGRVLDMIQKRYLRASDLKLLILDEADEMLSQGFSEKIKLMFQEHFPIRMQVVLFSATMPSDILTISECFMSKPIQILMKNEELSLQCIQQFYVAVQNDKVKYDVLRDLFSVISVSQCIIYCNSVRRVEDLCNCMIKDGYSVCCIHSGMEKSHRMQVFKSFKDGGSRVLISSDITARGIDVQQVSVVINFDLTRNVHTYLHRIGRSGRWGRKGFAINLITRQDLPDVKKIENYYQIDIKELPAGFNAQV
jgi:translation initiation factor 4A